MNPTELDDFHPRPLQAPRFDDEPHRPAQVPHEGAIPVPPRGAPDRPPPQIDYEGPRPEDTGDGRPTQIPSDLRLPTPEEIKAFEQADRDRLLVELQEVDELLEEQLPLFRLPRLIASPVLGSVLLGTSALLALFLFNQTMSAVGVIATLPPIWQWAVGSGLAVLGGAALYAFGRVAVWYFRLRRNVPVRFQVLQELDRRRSIRRWIVEAKWREAWQRMEQYLREYPLAPGKERHRLALLGCEPKILDELAAVREQLLDRDRFVGEDVALNRFRDAFQTKLDAVAHERVRYWARRAAVATALSPNTLADTLATLYFTFAMLGDVCAIYNLRTGRAGTAVLLARVFFNAYLAGQLNELEHLTEDQLTHLIQPHLGVSELLARVLGKASAKVGAGAVNYFLLNRLGTHACRMLRPVSRE
jgi:putative membrane protein